MEYTHGIAFRVFLDETGKKLNKVVFFLNVTENMPMGFIMCQRENMASIYNLIKIENHSNFIIYVTFQLFLIIK